MLIHVFGGIILYGYIMNIKWVLVQWVRRQFLNGSFSLSLVTGITRHNGCANLKYTAVMNMCKFKQDKLNIYIKKAIIKI